MCSGALPACTCTASCTTSNGSTSLPDARPQALTGPPASPLPNAMRPVQSGSWGTTCSPGKDLGCWACRAVASLTVGFWGHVCWLML